MKLQEAAHWAEIVSALGLVISLVYVGVQITDNTRATRSETASTANIEFIDWYAHLTTDPELIDLWLSGVTEPDTLNERQTLRFVFLLHIIMLQFQNNFYLVQEGTLDRKVLESLNNTITTIKGTPGWELYWSLRKNLMRLEYRAYIEDLMKNPDFQANPSYRP